MFQINEVHFRQKELINHYNGASHEYGATYKTVERKKVFGPPKQINIWKQIKGLKCRSFFSFIYFLDILAMIKLMS